jgi:hypothetical protein
MRDTHEEDKGGPTDTPPCREWLYSGRERERSPVDTLCFHPLVESEICHSDTEPGDQTSSSAKAGEPAKHSVGTALDRQVGEECKERAESDGDMRQARARCATEDPWSTARDSKTI